MSAITYDDHDTRPDVTYAAAPNGAQPVPTTVSPQHSQSTDIDNPPALALITATVFTLVLGLGLWIHSYVDPGATGWAIFFLIVGSVGLLVTLGTNAIIDKIGQPNPSIRS